MSRSQRRRLALALLVPLSFLGVACGDDGGDQGTGTADGGGEGAVDLRFGYFPNLTHATAVLGVENGTFERSLGEAATLETSTFDAGTEAVEALFAGELDATYIGPNPAINAHAQSKGEVIRIVAGATSGGAYLVVREGITRPADLEGTRIATPALGNTQDVALRSWLADQGFETDTEGGGDVSILPQENSQTLETFVAGGIDGAWVPEPWATRLQQEGDGTVLVDEADLWPEGEYVTTHLLVRTEYLRDNPEVVERLLEGHVEATDFVNADGEKAKRLVNQGIEAITGKTIAPEVIDAAWENLTFTVDPIASSLERSAADAEETGLLDPVDLEGIYDLSILNRILSGAGDPEVPAL
jgi:NitT/TauT family transport system substrate-binding protein